MEFSVCLAQPRTSRTSLAPTCSNLQIISRGHDLMDNTHLEAPSSILPLTHHSPLLHASPIPQGPIVTTLHSILASASSSFTKNLSLVRVWPRSHLPTKTIHDRKWLPFQPIRPRFRRAVEPGVQQHPPPPGLLRTFEHGVQWRLPPPTSRQMRGLQTFLSRWITKPLPFLHPLDGIGKPTIKRIGKGATGKK